jgi:hypothetical protein
MVWRIIGAGIGIALVTGLGIATVSQEVANDDNTMIEKAETSLVKLGYVSEGIVKGAIVSVPASVLILLLVNYGLKAQKKVVGGV